MTIWGLAYLTDRIRLVFKEWEERKQKRIERIERETMFPMRVLVELHFLPKNIVESIEKARRKIRPQQNLL